MAETKNLHILWTNADLETSQHMVMMYATNSMIHGWWDGVTVIIWGATARLAAENPIIQDSIRIAKKYGVQFTACIACADNLGVKGELEALGIEVKGWGKPLTELLQSASPLITI